MNICVLIRVTLSLLETPSAAAQMRLVIQKHGFGTKGGLMTGCTATLGRHGVWNAIYFGLFRTVMPIIVPDQKAISKSELNLKRFLLGCLCGTLGKNNACLGLFWLCRGFSSMISIN